jgi:hypothetical protein
MSYQQTLDELERRFEAIRQSRLDVLVFVGAFLTGLGLYFVLHWKMQTSQVVVTGTIVLIMMSYAVIVACAPRLRVRLDQAGDNAYYLGLLFTLVSMAFALYEFGTAVSGTSGAAANRTGTQQIIANFGVALASTITGIFLRISLHQMRVDPSEVESMTRIELAEASKRIRATLDTVTKDLALFHDEARQRSTDAANALLEDTARAVEALNHEVQRVTQEMMTAATSVHEGFVKEAKEQTALFSGMAAEAKAAIERLRSVEPPPLTLSRRLERVGKVLEAAGDQMERVVETIGRRLEQDSEALAHLEEQSKRSAEESLRAQEGSVEVLTKLTELTRGLTSVLNGR